MNINMVCIRKSENLDQNSNTFVSEVVLQPVVENIPQPGFATGAAIGTPNTGNQTAPNAPNAQEQLAQQAPKVTLTSPLSFTIMDKEEAAKYVVGQTYSFSVEPEKQKANK